MRTHVCKPWCHHQWCVMDGHGRGSGVNSSNIHNGKWFSAGNLPARDTTPVPTPPCLSTQGVPDKLHQPGLLRVPRLLMETEAHGDAWWIHTAYLGALVQLTVSQIFARRDVTPQNQWPGPKREEVVKMLEPIKVTNTVHGDESLLRKLWISGPCVFVPSLSRVQLSATPWAAAHQGPLSMGFSGEEYWSGLPCPPLGDLPNSGTEPTYSASQADSLSVSRYGQFNPVHQKRSENVFSDHFNTHSLYHQWKSMVYSFIFGYSNCH